MTVPAQPKLYHIVHVDRLRSIVADGRLCCDRALPSPGHGPPVEVRPEWYY